MSAFGDYPCEQVADAAEKFISKMDERDLAAAIEQSEQSMSPRGRTLLIDAIFHAFRQRGESSEDAAEAAGTSLESLNGSDGSATQLLLTYAKSNAGLLKEAATVLVAREPEVLQELPPSITAGIARKLNER